MTDGLKSQEEQELRAQAEQVRGRLESLADDLRAVDEEVERLVPERTHHELLDQAWGSLDKLGELGASSLFWGEQIESRRVAELLDAVRSRVSAFQARLDKLDDRRQAILASVGREEENLEILGEDLYQVREAEERRKLEWVVEREISPVPHHVQLMAWARGGEDDRRFRRSLVVSLLASLLFGLLFPMINLPQPMPFEPDAVPRRLAQFIRQAQARPVPPSPVVAQTSEQEPPEAEEPEPIEAPSEQQRPETQTVAAAEPEPAGLPGPLGPPPGPLNPERPVVAPPGPPERDVASAGILAFTSQIASLAQDRVAPRLGAQARFGDADEASRASVASRSLLTTNAPGSSGGINIDSLSRNVRGGGGGGGGGGGSGLGGGGGGGGGGLPGVEVGRATSSIASIAGGDRPTASGGPGASRTDEEIQIVFDRHKAEFYRFYNRELRNNPALQGQMVLRLTIEPDGSVSMCTLQSTDMDAPDLAAQVVNRVRTIDFGAKEDVEALTIVYPIDFLPASDG